MINPDPHFDLPTDIFKNIKQQFNKIEIQTWIWNSYNVHIHDTAAPTKTPPK